MSCPRLIARQLAGKGNSQLPPPIFFPDCCSPLTVRRSAPRIAQPRSGISLRLSAYRRGPRPTVWFSRSSSRRTATNRVFYLDPKLYAAGSRESSFRTFYFEPKIITNKVRDDAVHLLVGFEHQPRTAGRWEFIRWDLVDLAQFKVRLKAQFQGSHRDIDKPDAIVSSSAKQRPEVAPPSDGRNISGP